MFTYYSDESSHLSLELSCKTCKATSGGRNLILCFDGTSNQFGKNVFVTSQASRRSLANFKAISCRIPMSSNCITVSSKTTSSVLTTIAVSVPTLRPHGAHTHIGNRL